MAAGTERIDCSRMEPSCAGRGLLLLRGAQLNGYMADRSTHCQTASVTETAIQPAPQCDDDDDDDDDDEAQVFAQYAQAQPALNTVRILRIGHQIREPLEAMIDSHRYAVAQALRSYKLWMEKSSMDPCVQALLSTQDTSESQKRQI
eukprot:3210896-Amphidinium_carterae.2